MFLAKKPLFVSQFGIIIEVLFIMELLKTE